MRVAVTGATGRMGRTVLEEVRDGSDDVALAVSESAPGAEVAGTTVSDAADLETGLEESAPDVLVDFTVPTASVEYARTAAAVGVPVVIGTTGFDDGQEATLDRVGESVPVLTAANFARGIQALLDAVESVIADLPGYDVEVTETHHDGKRDAPSGTAGLVLDRIDEVRGQEAERVFGRGGDAPRSDGEIGVHARRAGDVTGAHEVLAAGNGESIALTHRAGSRSVFAAGALDAARWLVSRSPGRYRFADVADRLGETNEP
ncbi:MAG: 4-hydroxy-tetrahydrodipicolinate reductase [Halanaeroarchaeum sp.]